MKLQLSNYRAVGRAIIRMLNEMEKMNPSATSECSEEVLSILNAQKKLVVVKDLRTGTSTIQSRHRQLSLFD